MEETEKSEFANRKLRKVVIEVDYDDLTLAEMMDDLVRPALLAMTFAEKSIADYFGDDE